ncbi:helix-turn-helix domain-containing protein [Paenibacillus puerhi]|uniref:helix-turn-helix domain-containing protein n=1 Tax=Paenibacillus puerhi TaxID=2692622 RepID=UPI001358E57E|nr:helix-turn-helix domain-containing protein [Paenibacillus puerhi]
MYKVILADDYKSVLEYLTAKIPWQELGLELVAVCSDGEEALEACRRTQPDILITDIGMPLMNGLDLIEAARQDNPGLKTVILSCHEDFQYAQRAVKLSVNDYILKETLRIEQLLDILHKLTLQLKEEHAALRSRQQLQDVVFQSRSSLRTSFIRSLIDQPVWNEAEWTEKAAAFGLRMEEGFSYLPVLGVLDRFPDLEARFGGGHHLQYVVENALNESVNIENSAVFAYSERYYYLLYPYPKTLKINRSDQIMDELRLIQKSMRRYLKIGISFYTADISPSVAHLKKQLISLLNERTFRFYSGEHALLKLRPMDISKEDLFVHYAAALNDFRTCMLEVSANPIKETLAQWMEHIARHKYPMDSVRSWMLKLVTDMELKYTVMQHFLTNYSSELLQHHIYTIDTLEHLGDWLYHFLMEKRKSYQEHHEHAKRKEIAAAQRYVMMHLHEKISMEETALRLQMNPTHFSRIFKKETGETFVEFVTRCKMERAQELLDQSDQRVEQISEGLGYDNMSYFFKLFRQFSGMSPTEYRKRL